MTSTAWANPHQLHPWFRMPTHKRKDLSDSEEEVSAYYQPHRSLSPAPSPKRRRCDILENGMSQLTLDGWSIAPPAPYILASAAPTVQYPETPTTTASRAGPFWGDAPYAPRVTPIPTSTATPVVLPGSVEEPVTPETGGEDVEVRDVAMKGPSWYEIEKDRIVIVDLEDSDTEDENTPPHPQPDAAAFTISSALLDRLPKPHAHAPRGPPGPGAGASASNALVLYRPLPLAAPLPDESRSSSSDAGKGREDREDETGQPMAMGPESEEVPMEDTRPCTPTPMVFEAGSTSVLCEPVDEPMDIEML